MVEYWGLAYWSVAEVPLTADAEKDYQQVKEETCSAELSQPKAEAETEAEGQDGC